MTFNHNHHLLLPFIINLSGSFFIFQIFSTSPFVARTFRTAAAVPVPRTLFTYLPSYLISHFTFVGFDFLILLLPLLASSETVHCIRDAIRLCYTHPDGLVVIHPLHYPCSYCGANSHLRHEAKGDTWRLRSLRLALRGTSSVKQNQNVLKFLLRNFQSYFWFFLPDVISLLELSS